MKNIDPRHYDVIVAPVVTEKATVASEHNKVVFKVASQGDQAANQGSRREAVRRQGEEREHAGPQGQDQGVPRQFRFAVGREAGDRDPRRGPPHRRHHRTIRRYSDGIENIQSDDARPAPAGDGRPFGALQGQAGQGVDRGQARQWRPQQHRPHHRALPRRRPQEGLPHGRLQAQQGRRSRGRRAAGIRSEPHRVHRADQVSGRRAGLYPGAAAAGRRATPWSPATMST